MGCLILHELITLSNELIDAVHEHDLARLELLLAAEFTLNGAAGELDRETFLEAAAGPYEIDDWAYEEIDPEIYGNTAVLVSRYRQTARLQGRDLSHQHARDGHLGAPRRPLADRPSARHDRLRLAGELRLPHVLLGLESDLVETLARATIRGRWLFVAPWIVLTVAGAISRLASLPTVGSSSSRSPATAPMRPTSARSRRSGRAASTRWSRSSTSGAATSATQTGIEKAIAAGAAVNKGARASARGSRQGRDVRLRRSPTMVALIHPAGVSSFTSDAPDRGDAQGDRRRRSAGRDRAT